MDINGKTTVCAVIGDPIAHTLSPCMHNAAYRAAGLDFVYVAYHVQDVKKALEGVRGLGIRGLSVTIPHKVAIMEHLDDLSPLSRKIGAVNTVLNDRGRLFGTNTDAYGVLRAIESREDPAGKNILILGVGGACRAAAYALACERKPRSICLAARDADQALARALAEELTLHSDVPVRVVSLDPAETIPVFEQADIVVNTTPVGMSPHVRECLVSEELLSSRHLVFDMIYNPAETELLRRARARGARTVNGVPMFVHQGAEQFRLWTGVEAPVEVMQEAVEGALGYR